MKREHFHSSPPRRLGRLGPALLVAVLFGLLGALKFEAQPDEGNVVAPAWRATFNDSAGLGDRAWPRTPDHALLSAGDVERALPVPSRTSGMTESVVS
jgi:hypothetical protein